MSGVFRGAQLFPSLFSEENTQSVSAFLKDLKDNKLIRGILLRDCDSERRILLNIDNDYRALFTLATSKNQNDVRVAAEEIQYNIHLLTYNEELTYKTQLRALKIILKELLEHYEVYQKKISDLDGKSSDGIEIATNSVVAFYHFFQEHYSVIFQMRKERCLFVQSFNNKYVYNVPSLAGCKFQLIARI